MKLAFLFNVSVPVLKRTNNLISDELYPGQIIKVTLPETAEVLKNEAIVLAEDEESLKAKMTPGGAKQSFYRAGDSSSMYRKASNKDSSWFQTEIPKYKTESTTLLDYVSEEEYDKRISKNSTDVGKPTSGGDTENVLGSGGNSNNLDANPLEIVSKSMYQKNRDPNDLLLDQQE